MAANPRIPIWFGGGLFGAPGSTVPVQTLEEANEIVDTLLRLGQNGIDTSNMYSAGTSEEFIGKLASKELRVDTKVWPLKDGDHSAANLAVAVPAAAEKLRAGKDGKPPIRIMYLHRPDRTVPYEETHKALDELHKQGYFEELGLSNFHAFEVAEFVLRAEHYGWVKPTVYQGVYSAIVRSAEHELFPALTKYGIRFVAYSPLGGGILTGKLLEEEPDEFSHFSPKLQYGSYFREAYLPWLPFLKRVKPIADQYGLTLTEVALRWIQHHGRLDPARGDIVLLGARNSKQLEESVRFSEKGPLPEDLLKAIEEEYQNANIKYTHYAM